MRRSPSLTTVLRLITFWFSLYKCCGLADLHRSVQAFLTAGSGTGTRRKQNFEKQQMHCLFCHSSASAFGFGSERLKLKLRARTDITAFLVAVLPLQLMQMMFAFQRWHQRCSPRVTSTGFLSILEHWARIRFACASVVNRQHVLHMLGKSVA